MNIFGKKTLYFDTVTSTFDELSKRTPEQGLAVVAKRQTAGTGRSGRQWLSNDGGLYFSFYILPDVQEEVSFVAIQCALAAYKTLREYIDCSIKWPNDIVSGGKKVCGVLIKSFVTDKKITLMAGVGINVNNIGFTSDLSDRATSLKEITGKDEDADEILKSFFSNFEDMYCNFTKEDIITQYKKACITIGSEVCVHYNSVARQVKGVCTNVRADGTLDVQTDEGTINVNSGEVSVRGVYGYV